MEQLAALVIDKKKLPEGAREIGGEADYRTLIDLKVIQMAISGNLDAAKLAYKMLGEDPLAEIKKKELTLREKELSGPGNDAVKIILERRDGRSDFRQPDNTKV